MGGWVGGWVGGLTYLDVSVGVSVEEELLLDVGREVGEDRPVVEREFLCIGGVGGWVGGWMDEVSPTL